MDCIINKVFAISNARFNSVTRSGFSLRALFKVYAEGYARPVSRALQSVGAKLVGRFQKILNLSKVIPIYQSLRRIMECYIRRYNPRFAHAHTQIILSSMIRLDIQVFRAMCYSEQIRYQNIYNSYTYTFAWNSF